MHPQLTTSRYCVPARRGQGGPAGTVWPWSGRAVPGKNTGSLGTRAEAQRTVRCSSTQEPCCICNRGAHPAETRWALRRDRSADANSRKSSGGGTHEPDSRVPDGGTRALEVGAEGRTPETGQSSGSEGRKRPGGMCFQMSVVTAVPLQTLSEVPAGRTVGHAHGPGTETPGGPGPEPTALSRPAEGL